MARIVDNGSEVSFWCPNYSLGDASDAVFAK